MALKRIPFLLSLLLAGILILPALAGGGQDAMSSLPAATPTPAGSDHTPFDPAQLRPGQPYPGAGYPWQRVARAAPVGGGPPAPPEGIDLDVTFISRTPKYKSYCVTYSWDPPGQPGIPTLCPGTEDEQRWAAAGEVVTFTAHIANKGTQASPAFAYRWEIDGAEVAAGVLPGLAAGAATTASYQWPWGHVMDGERVVDDHTVRFTVDPLNDIAETYKTNNTLADRTNALGLRIAITPEMMAAYSTPWDPAFSYSAEDWLQRQIKAMNWVFENSVYPTTPAGATERVRIDEIVVTSEPPINDRSSDGGWFVDADYRIVSGWYDPLTDIDWALVHELSHQVGVIDLYQLGMDVTSVHVLDRDGMPANFGFTWPRPDLMGGGDIAPHTDGHLYSSHGAAGFSSTKGYRRGYYGEYQFDIPAENWLLVLDNQGNPAADVAVSLYQRNGPTVWPGDVTIDNVPEFMGLTGADGRVRLANRQIVGGPWATATGHVLRDNPFGVVDVVGGRNRFLVKLARGKHEEFAWLDITDFNLAYWRGQEDSATFTLASHVPAESIPAAPEGLSAQVANGQVTLRWQASLIPEVRGYHIYRATRPTYAYERIAGPITDSSYLTECLGRDCIYTVTALDFDGRESGFSAAAWAPDLVLPGAVVAMAPTPPAPSSARERGATFSPLLPGEGPGVRSIRVILDTHAGPLIRQLPDERYLGRLGSVHFGLTNSRYLAVDSLGRFLVTNAGSNVVRVTDAAIQPLFEFGGEGAGPGQFREPAGVAVWGQPCTIEGPHANDPHALLLLHFDGSYHGANGEIGNANGVSFTTGRYDRGLLMDDADTLSYETAGNLNRTQGAIEFWVRPEWDGNDGQDYVFFEAGAEWFNRMMIVKDGANNLRLMTWDSAQEYGVAHPIGDWRAGEWHHVAATWDAAALALYVDGQLVDRNAQTRPPERLADRFSIGSHVWGGSQVNATLDEFRISDISRVGNSDTCSYRILVADSGNDRIQAFDSTGRFISAYGTSGSGPGQFRDPQGLAVDDLGRVIVVDRGNNRLQLLGFDGQSFSYLATITGGFNGPTGAWAYGSDRILVADTGNNVVKELIPEGATYIVKEHRPPTPFNEPRGAAADRDGNLIVADTGNRRIVTLPGVLPTFTPSLPVTPTTAPTATPTPTPSATPTPTGTPSVTPTPTTTISGSISGVVWHDRDGDGSRDPGEPGLAAVIIHLSRWETEIAETQTAADGSYRFAPLAPDALYRVREAQPAWLRWSTTPDEVQIALANGQHAVADFGDWNGRPTWLPLIVR